MSIQSQSKVLVVLEKIEHLTVIKNEPTEIVEIGIDDILDSSDEESIEDIKDIEIVSHELSEDLIKSETVSENILENSHPDSIETQIFVKTENNPFIETENITQSENLNKTENASDGNVNRGTGQELIEVQGSNEHFNAFANQTDKQHVLNFSKNLSNISLRSRKLKRSGKTDFSKCDTLVETTSYKKLKKNKEKRKVIEVPMLRVEPHESITLDKNACNKNKSIHKKHKARYCYEKCMYTSEISSRFKLHQLTHKTKADRLLKYRCDKCKYKTFRHQDFKKHKLIHLKPEEIQLKYRCDKCKYKTFRHQDFKKHKLIHLKPEEIQYFYCYHCSYKCKLKSSLKSHIFLHFKNEDVLFHCYICDFVTLKRDLIIEHFKTHPKHHSKCDETEYKYQLEICNKRYCCEKCTYTSGNSSHFKLHQLIHKTKAEIDDRLLKYRCDKCTYKTFRHQDFKKHKLIHLKPEEIQYFYCYHCSYKCKRKGYLKTHIFRHFKNEDVPFYCYICDFVTLKRDLIIEHFKRHPKYRSKWDETEYKYQLPTCNKRYCCEKCTYTSGISSEFKLHQLSHKTKAKIDDRLLKYRCDKCKYKTFIHQNFKRHKLVHLKPEEIQYFYCYHCSYKCKLKSSLKSHIFRHFKNEDLAFHCYICDFVTLKRDLIIEHFKTHPKHHSKCGDTEYKYHLEICKERYCCEKCTYTSEISSHFKLHQLTHKTKAEIDDRLLKYRCDKCKYKTFIHQNFKMHKLIHLKPEEIQYFYCYHCSYKCKRKGHLKTHIFRHFKNEDVRFHCYICDFVTLKRDLIIEHFKAHPKHHSKCDETEYKYQLEICNKRYCCEKCTYTSEASSHFKLHQLTHKTKAEIDDRLLKYRCDKCKYKTSWCSSLKRHKLIHLKPEEIQYFYCYHCSYKCKRKGDLKNHIFRHFKNEDVRFHCYICDFVTLKRDLIIEHFKTHPKHHSKYDETEYISTNLKRA